MRIQNQIIKELYLPHNTLAEKLILAGIISNPHLLNRIVNVIEPEVFFDDKHKEIYESIVDIYNTTTEIDLLTIVSILTEKETLDYIGEVNEIEHLGNNLINNDKFEEYIYLIMDKFFRRSIIQSSQKLLNMVKNELIPLDDVLNQFEELFFKLNKNNYLSSKEFKITTLLNKLVHNIEDKKKSTTYSQSINSGFEKFDRLTQGFQKSDLIIIASRPSMGKTALVLNMASNIAKKQQGAVVFFSLEMSSEQLMYRLLAHESRIPIFNLRQGQIEKEDWNKIQHGIKKLTKLSIYIDDTPNVTVQNLKSKIYQLLQLNKKLSVIIIDYLQLIQTQTVLENRTQELAYITRSLKIMCREFNLPIIVLSQLNRTLESRNNKKPILSDLRESGCISMESIIAINKKYLKIYKITYTACKIIYSCNKNNIIVLSAFNKMVNNKLKILYQIITKSGYFLEATGNHKIKTKKGWIRICHLTHKDKIAITEENFIKHNRFSNFYKLKFESIETISLIGENRVYDLEMNKLQNFIANNIVIHNSIEQDADLVCMLYRESYYKQEEQSKQDKNTAEISILKHRNGPTGTFNLVFNPTFAEFTEI
nr:DnaB [Pseudoerythrocladia kornmannii]